MSMWATLQIQRATVAPNSAGTPVDTWAPVVTLRAEILERAVEERVGDAGATDNAAITFRTRFYDGLKLADRITFNGSTYNIRQIVETGRRRGLEIRATWKDST